jgi:uncharacterized protein (DUF305 family)
LTRVLLLCVALVAVGCSPDDRTAPAPPSSPTQPPSSSSEPPIIVPGTPGGPNRTVTSMPTVSETVDPDDVTFLRDMIVHHQQAVVMTELARTRASDRSVRSLAERIRVGQKPDIDAMSRMLTQRGQQPPDLAHAHHASMPGMASPAQMDALAKARGAQFDRMLLQLMIRHHQGALEMCRVVINNGSDLMVNQLAAEIQVTQAKEISIMRKML